MKIPQPLPQFENNKTLFVVTGDELAEFYAVYSGILAKVGDYEFHNPVYADREGFFMSSSRGKMLGSGAVYENLEPYVDKKFLKGLSKKTKEIVHDQSIDDIYIFTPTYMKYLVFDSLPKNLQKIVKTELIGNYTKKHPLDIVKRIKREEDRRRDERVPVNKEVRKIMEKTARAREVIKGKPE